MNGQKHRLNNPENLLVSYLQVFPLLLQFLFFFPTWDSKFENSFWKKKIETVSETNEYSNTK